MLFARLAFVGAQQAARRLPLGLKRAFQTRPRPGNNVWYYAKHAEGEYWSVRHRRLLEFV